MALPKLNEHPSYEMVVPSTSQKVKYRPFLVKEQKVLLMALESQDPREIVNSIIATIKSCVVEDVDVESLATFDVEYMFTKIRAKSVGETSNLNITCENCETPNEVTVNLDKIEVNKPDVSNTVNLGNNMSIRMRYPSYNNTNMDMEASTYSETLYNLVIASLDVLKTEDEVIKFQEENINDVREFVNNLTAEQYDSLVKFISNLPSVSEEVKFKCKSCGHDNVRVLKGLQDFF